MSNNNNKNRVITCAALIAGKKVGFSIPMNSKGLVYAGQHAQYFPIVNPDGSMKEGITLKPRKAGGFSVECSKVIVTEGGRSHVPSGEWHNGIRYTLSIKLETPQLALVTLRLETAGSDIQQFIKMHISDDVDLINAANALKRAREQAAIAASALSAEEMAAFKAWQAAQSKAKNAPTTEADKTITPPMA